MTYKIKPVLSSEVLVYEVKGCPICGCDRVEPNGGVGSFDSSYTCCNCGMDFEVDYAD